MRILLVEDDALLGDALQVGLRQEGKAVDWVGNATLATQALTATRFDLVVLDLGLPGRDGLEVLERLREAGDATPVIVVTARDSLQERVRGLDAGADDYLAKPFDLEELCARARALSRRASGRAVPLLEVGELVLDPAGHRVSQAGREIDLSPREFALLRILMDNAGRVMLKSRLHEMLFGWEEDVSSNALEVHVHHLRRKLDAGWIHTVRGVGYRLETGA